MNKRKIIIVCVIFIIVAISLIIGRTLYLEKENKDFLNSVNAMLPAQLEYDGVIFREINFTADYICRFTVAKRKVYRGTIDTSQKSIEIIIPANSRLTIYPNDDNSVVVEYKPRSSRKKTYILYDYGNFKRHLEILYELTADEVFSPDNYSE